MPLLMIQLTPKVYMLQLHAPCTRRFLSSGTKLRRYAHFEPIPYVQLLLHQILSISKLYLLAVVEISHFRSQRYPLQCLHRRLSPDK